MSKRIVPVEERCTEKVWRGGGFGGSARCDKRAKVDGKCGIHSDEFKARMEKKREDSYKAWRANFHAKHEAQALRVADAGRMAWLVEHDADIVETDNGRTINVWQWIELNKLRRGGLRSCIDDLMKGV